MANLTENPVYETGIFKLEVTTPAKGGEPVFVGGEPTDGFANAQAQQLANRTNFLKQQVDSLTSSKEQVLEAGTGITIDRTNPSAPVISATGGGTGAVDSVDGQIGVVDLSGNYAPLSHVGSRGTGVHTNATTTEAGFMSASDKSKLNGVATGATANESDAYLLDRVNHTGTQAISTVSGLQNALDDKEYVLTAGTNVTIDRTDPLNPIINASISGGGGGDVVGPASVVNNDVALFDGISGKLIKSGGQLGTAAFTSLGDYATAVQGDLADTSLQPSDIGVTVQEQLVSGINIKTINGNPLLGSGNITISGGGSSSIDGTQVSNFTATINTSYWLPSSLTVTLPDTTSVPDVGSFVRFYKTHSAAPIIQAGVGGASIVTSVGTDTSITYDIPTEITFIFNGTDWEV